MGKRNEVQENRDYQAWRVAPVLEALTVDRGEYVKKRMTRWMKNQHKPGKQAPTHIGKM